MLIDARVCAFENLPLMARACAKIDAFDGARDDAGDARRGDLGMHARGVVRVIADAIVRRREAICVDERATVR